LWLHEHECSHMGWWEASKGNRSVKVFMVRLA
jgi:hypothetical protein